MSNLAKDANKQSEPYEFVQIANSSKFKQLMSQKKKFLIPLTVFFLLFYFMLPILTSYTTILNKPAIGPITWTWVYAFAQFIMTWALCMIYVRRAMKFDELAAQIVEEAKQEGAGNE
ncbi:integral membrane protein [Mycobacteroides abscessus subsp. abscessus]|nr:integral membrane protein [Mycobacteroides abscessus subsp. abscessus]